MKLIVPTLLLLFTISCKNAIENSVHEALNDMIETAKIENEDWADFYSKFQVAIKNNDLDFLEERSYPSSTFDTNMKIIKEIQGDETMLNHFTVNAKGAKLESNDPYFTEFEVGDNFHYVDFEGGREFLRLTFAQLYGSFVLIEAKWYQ